MTEHGEAGARATEDPAAGQTVVDRYFDSAAEYWQHVYGHEGLQGVIYRERMEAVMRWVDDLHLPAQAAALDVGCGAGLLAARLAQRDLRVVAVDASIEMVRLAERHAQEQGSTGQLRVLRADVHELPFEAETFDLVLAIGLLPWLHNARVGLAEMARVLRRGGWLIATADNRARLNLLTEPRENPLVAPLKPLARALKRALGNHPSGAPSYLHLPAQVDRLLLRAGLRPARRTTIGFGPFTFLGHAPLSEPAALRLHRGLSALSAQRIPSLRRMGWHYLVAARKPDPR